MTKIGNATYTDLNDDPTNAELSAAGYTIRHVEDHRLNDGHVESAICWDAPDRLTDADFPF